MKKICITLAVLGVAMAAGCRSLGGGVTRHEVVSSEMRGQVAALSNAVHRLDRKMDVLERKWDELQPSLEPVFFILEQMMNEPVVQEKPDRG